jgi:hypothetical protein
LNNFDDNAEIEKIENEILSLKKKSKRASKISLTGSKKLSLRKASNASRPSAKPSIQEQLIELQRQQTQPQSQQQNQQLPQLHAKEANCQEMSPIKPFKFSDLESQLAKIGTMSTNIDKLPARSSTPDENKSSFKTQSFQMKEFEFNIKK